MVDMLALGDSQLRVLDALHYHKRNMTICEAFRPGFNKADNEVKQKVRSQVNNILQRLRQLELVKHEEGYWNITDLGRKYREINNIIIEYEKSSN